MSKILDKSYSIQVLSKSSVWEHMWSKSEKVKIGFGGIPAERGERLGRWQ